MFPCVFFDGKLIMEIKHFSTSESAIIDIKESDYCTIHFKSFRNECHRLPSGKTMWLGCNECQSAAREKSNRKDLLNYHESIGMQWDSATKTWTKKDNSQQETENDLVDAYDYKNRKYGDK